MKKSKTIEPYLVIAKKKHPFGKPIEASFDNLRMWIAPTYMTEFGFTKDKKLAMGESKVDNIQLFFETKKENGWIHFNKETGRKLFESLKQIYDEKKNGKVKKTYAGFTVTKYRRYK